MVCLDSSCDEQILALGFTSLDAYLYVRQKGSYTFQVRTVMQIPFLRKIGCGVFALLKSEVSPVCTMAVFWISVDELSHGITESSPR